MEISVSNAVHTYFKIYTKAASLAVFRILFGFVMCLSILRFWYNGWIEKLYLEPKFHFHYAGFEWVQVPGNYTYIVFALCGISAFLVCLGWKYRIAVLFFFLSFSYLELMDKTNYLNHYYFVSVVSFILLFLPASASYSIDAWKNPNRSYEFIPKWNVDILKLMLAIVYIYAGLAKLNVDWMFNAMPLAIWLPTKVDVPLLGNFMHNSWMHYLFSWGGAFYDLTIVFFLLWKRTRILAFIAVVVFHLLTRILFPIGMFPYIMICCTLIFFSPSYHERFLEKGIQFFKMRTHNFRNGIYLKTSGYPKIATYILSIFMLFQIIFPLRYLWKTDNVFWTEDGYRYSWRVMLMEKTGYANFKIKDGVTDKRFYVQNQDFLTARQEKQMSTQADFILEYGKYLGNHFAGQGHENVQVFVESYAALNGRKRQVYIDSDVDLMQVDYRTLVDNHIQKLNE